MAKASNVIVRPRQTPEEGRAAALGALGTGAADSSVALLEALQLLQALHENGALEALTALFRQGNEALGVVVDTLDQPAYGQGARNAFRVAEALTAVDERSLATFLRTLTGGLQALAEPRPPAKRLSVFDLLRSLKDPDVSAGVDAVLALLRGMGAAQRAAGPASDFTGKTG